MLSFAMLLLIAGFAAVGDIWVYKWAKSRELIHLGISFASWAVSLWLYGVFLRKFDRSLTISFVVLAVFQTVLITLWEWYATDNRWSRGEVFGILMAIAGVIAIECSRGQD